MGPAETKDLIFAGGGVLCGAVIIFQGINWKRVIVGAALAISCLGYLVRFL